jgi:hypothetical protein
VGAVVAAVVAAMEGAVVGTVVGFAVGTVVGFAVGAVVGLAVGTVTANVGPVVVSGGVNLPQAQSPNKSNPITAIKTYRSIR